MTTTKERLKAAREKLKAYEECPPDYLYPVDTKQAQREVVAALEDLQWAEERLAQYESGAHVMVPRDTLRSLLDRFASLANETKDLREMVGGQLSRTDYTLWANTTHKSRSYRACWDLLTAAQQQEKANDHHQD